MFKYFKQTLLLLSCIVSLFASAQNLISPITISLPANPPANTAEWATTLPPVMILAQTKLINGQINGSVVESKILVTIKSGGTKICGSYTAQTAPNSNFSNTTKNWTGANVLSLLGQECILKPGSYELCVQFYGMSPTQGGLIILGENCKPFTIADKKQDAQTFSPPQNINPANEKAFTEKEAKAPITFRWTPVLPKPKDQVTYRLKVWQLMQGQNGIAAMKSNTPVIEKDVKDLTQYVEPNILGDIEIINNSAKLIWNVEATRQNQMGEVQSLGFSEPTNFMVSSGSNVDKKDDSVFCKNQGGNYPIKFTIVNNDNYNRTFNGMSIYSINNVVQGTYPGYLPIPFSQFTPSYGTIINANSTLNVTGYINYSGVLNNISIIGQTTGGTPPKAGDFDITKDLVCACTTCDNININVNTNPTQSLINNNVKFSQPISITALPTNTALPIKSVTAEILYVDVKKDDEQCYRCDKNSEHFGKIIKARLTQTGFSQTATLPNGEAIFSNATATILSNANIELEIAAPDLNKCCKDIVTVCVKYTIVTADCKSCSVTKCYALPRAN